MSAAPGHTLEPRWLKPVLITIALLFLAVFILLPLVTIFSQALSVNLQDYLAAALGYEGATPELPPLFASLGEGTSVYRAALSDAEVRAAIRLTLLTALICVPLNTFFGVLLAWAVARFEFRGKNFLVSLIELPFAISPVIAGLIFILIFGASGWLNMIPFGTQADGSTLTLYQWMDARNLKVVFAVPGIVLATLFVTFPFVARELIPLMQEMGKDDEEAALTLGASGWQLFFRVTLPNIKWGLLYGVILTNARAIGEFGAVAVVSGNVRGETTTMPLYIEILYGEYQFATAFAVASLLTLIALVTLVVKAVIEYLLQKQRTG
ncbi:MAG: sulfate ABC transporter permease subunit CysW [Zoogloeaceae bacterium]|jgi:sulfate transport system permease protein|nr:sulfate ABC transporter permease subunit CysW [Zoogloeaceae bacterium]